MLTTKRLLLLGLLLTGLVSLIPSTRATVEGEQKEVTPQSQVAVSNLGEEGDDLDNYAEYEGDDESEIDTLKPVYTPSGPNPVGALEYQPEYPTAGYPNQYQAPSYGQQYQSFGYGQQPVAYGYGQQQVALSYGPQQAPLYYGTQVQAPAYPSQSTSYVQAPAQVYSNYSAPVQAPVYSNYSAPVQAPVYSNYSAPIQAPVYSNYSAPVQQVQPQVYNKPNYIQQSYGPQPNYSVATNYIKPSAPIAQAPSYVVSRPQVSYQPQVANYSQQQSYGTKSSYSLLDLSPFVSNNGYVSNHWSLFYYRSAPYRACPKNVYLAPPTQRDVEAAFRFAQLQLQGAQGQAIQYINGTHLSATARHQVFSFISQQSSRMDEEGLLIELVSTYLADRACLTKWDKQRYLPQLTKLVSSSNFPGTHSCSNYYNQNNQWRSALRYCAQSKYRTIDGFCNNPYHPYWGKSNVCHLRLLSPDYADGISQPRNSYNPRFPLPNPRLIANYIHNDIPLDSPYNLMKMQWGQFINHDITNTALSSYDGLVDCCKNPTVRGCWPISVPPGDRFYGPLNVTCLNFIRSGVCPICELGPRQQINKNTAFMDASHVYGNTIEQAQQLRTFQKGLLKVSYGKNQEHLLPIATLKGQEQCSGSCFVAGDSRVNQHPALTAMHTIMLRNHNYHALKLSSRHPDWNDEYIFQEARRINIAEYQMITYNEYLPIVFGPILSSYYKLLPLQSGHTYYNAKVDPTTWNEYSTASCRFGHSQIQSVMGLYTKLISHGQQDPHQPTFPLREWFLRPSFLNEGLLPQITYGLLGKVSQAVDPWIAGDVRNHLYKSHKEASGGDLAATNIWRGRDHGIPAYVHYVEYCFNIKVHGWKDLSLFIPQYTLNQLRKVYKVVENVDLFTGGLSERHFPGADIGPTFACINGIQYYHLKFGDRYYFEHGGQSGSFTPEQLAEIKRTNLAKILCRNAGIKVAPAYAFLQASNYNPIVDCVAISEFNYSKF